MANQFLMLGPFALTCSLALTSDPSPLQDFCVANTNSQVLLNGLVCKDPKLVQANDFFFAGLHNSGNTSNKLGSAVSPVTVAQLPGLNTFGISMVQIVYVSWGLIPPHSHPRASKILTVLEGTLHVSFVTSNPENRLMTKVLQKGDAQNPGIVTMANAVFGSNEPIFVDVLAKAFQVDKKVVDYLQTQF
ncbi:hypothetical protein AAC387_Pa08g1602 [Persea americana]